MASVRNKFLRLMRVPKRQGGGHGFSVSHNFSGNLAFRTLIGHERWAVGTLERLALAEGNAFGKSTVNKWN